MNRVERAMVFAIVAAMIGAVAMMLITSQRYMDLKNLIVHDARQGQPIAITYDREFKREFFGEWSVFVWQIDRGEPQSYCETGGAWPYKPGVPDRQKTLEWLVDGYDRCFKLPPGLYSVEVHIKANPGKVLERRDQISSNVFEVTE